MEEQLLAPYEDGEIKKTYTVLARRWYILFVASLIAFSQGFIWNNFGPIALTLTNKTVFDWDAATISLIGNWGPIAYVVAFMPTAWMLDTIAFRPTAIIAALLVFTCTGIRLISTGPTMECKIIMHVAQLLNGLAGPFAMAAGPVLSAAWFAPNERTTSTAVFCTSNSVGVAASYLIGPLFVPQDGTIKDVRKYLWFCFALASVSLTLVAIYLPSKPPLGFEPSRTASTARMDIKDGIAALCKQKNFWYICIAYGMMTGLYAGWGPLYSLIIETLGTEIAPYPQKTASWIGFWSNLGGNIAGMLFAKLADSGFGRAHFRKFLIVLSFFGAVVFGLFAVLFVNRELLLEGGLPVVYILCILAGIFVNSTVPIFYELAVDTTYPVAEGLTTSLLTVMNNIGGLIFLLIPMVGLSIGDWVNYSVGSACVLSIICMSMFEGKLERTKEDKKGE
jgi:FLVCR family MFS transporter